MAESSRTFTEDEVIALVTEVLRSLAPEEMHARRIAVDYVQRFAPPRSEGEAVERVAKALEELVRLKDGPRSDAYRAQKDNAWEQARAAIAAFREPVARGETE